MVEYRKYKRVLFCTDFSENADYAFELAYGIAKRDRGVLYILHIIPDVPQQQLVQGLIPRDLLEETEARIKEDMDREYEERYVKNMDNSVPYEIVTKSGREDDEILKFAREEKVDLIVMGTHGSTGIERVFFGSVAEKVIRHSPFPVFIIPCRRKPEFPSTIYLYRGREREFVRIQPKG